MLTLCLSIFQVQPIFQLSLADLFGSIMLLAGSVSYHVLKSKAIFSSSCRYLTGFASVILRSIHLWNKIAQHLLDVCKIKLNQPYVSLPTPSFLPLLFNIWNTSPLCDSYVTFLPWEQTCTRCSLYILLQALYMSTFLLTLNYAWAINQKVKNRLNSDGSRRSGRSNDGSDHYNRIVSYLC